MKKYKKKHANITKTKNLNKIEQMYKCFHEYCKSKHPKGCSYPLYQSVDLYMIFCKIYSANNSAFLDV